MQPPAPIRILSPVVANKIAAGEVVERPASVLKELLENAIDAGASQIDVDIVAGGRKLVAVRDNGTGMNRDNALLCVERHATSKIRDVDDIEKIATLGFRGEALAAIASVSRFHLVTCQTGDVAGTDLLIVGGKVQDVRDVGCPAGTTIEVRDLFFNVPARRKFLRAYQTELAHVRSTFLIEALAHPRIGMSLEVDGREAYRLAGGASVEDRVADLFGSDYLKDLRRIDHDAEGIRMAGYTSLPAVSRADRNEQYIFVNGRPTSAAILNYAIREGYHTLLPADRHPLILLFLEMSPWMVDVNVHPTKREVRFRSPAALRDAVITAIREALAAGSARGAAPPSPEADAAPPPGGPNAAAEVQLQIENLPAAAPFRYPSMPMAGRAGLAPPSPGSDAPGARGAPGGETPSSEPAPPPPAPGAAAPWAWCRVVGQIGSLYVVLETEDGFVVMDPHASHERVLFERFMSDLRNGRVDVQNLLLPETVDLQPKDALRVRQSMEAFRAMGFGLSEFGGDSFVVDALPACFAGAAPKALLIEVAHALEQDGTRGGSGRWREESIARAACRSAVMARDKLTLEEIEKLVADLARTEMPYTCPHGRPTLIFTSFRDLNRKFGRE